MTAFTDIDAEASARIADIDQQATDALELVAKFMPTIEALAWLRAPYYAPANAKATLTKFDQSGVTKQNFDELSNTDRELQVVGALRLNPLNAGSKDVYLGLKDNLDTPNSALETIWTDLQTKYPDPTPKIAFDESKYVAEIIEGLQDKLASALSDDEGRSTKKEAQYYANDSASRYAARRRERDDTLNEFSGRGFPFPADVQADMASYVQSRQNDYDQERQAAIQRSALSVENKAQAIASGLRYDQILVSYFERKAARAFQVASAGLKFMQDLADIQFYVLQNRLSGQKEYFDLIGQNQRVIFDEFDQNAKGFSERLDALVQQSGGYLGAYSIEGDVFGIRKRALNENHKFSLSEAEINMDTLRWNLANALKAFTDNLQAFESTARIRLGAARSGAEVQIGIAESAKNSIMSVIGQLTNDKTMMSETSET